MPKVNLSWKANTEADLAGYRVYRKVGSAALTKLTDVGKTVLAYTDDAIPVVDADIAYQLSAFDTSGNESGLTAPQVVTVNSVPPATPVGLSAVLV